MISLNVDFKNKTNNNNKNRNRLINTKKKLVVARGEGNEKGK